MTSPAAFRTPGAPQPVPWTCMRCGQSFPRLRVLSVSQGSFGSLYIAELPQPGVDMEHIQLLCSSCWPHMLMWNARRGFDIHTHAYTAVCDRSCLTKTIGRRAQNMALRSLISDSKQMFFLCKEIDGQPRVNGTCTIMGCRVGFFINAPANRQYCYESIANPG
jgi:hypothetical protein